ncbi:acyl-ACP--UDP-N-acetylglucosamine O-acyltransferase [Afipia felis]|uniref:Acyl-[acyl-carrier-protein]--UDP-N-acetylglucosamine O-acyltransferase n=2 Tax=Afipia felis TaxID=1035 RepID=A0A380W2D0_AFIFE|nr:acyl-ACP--UDP-N-acetylglucosamine O-acyltransferase [Afipia felis]EKS30283.1 acyl-[acyl-carrier-protein]-UDP-N-acetylglucosamine O-acyltransferase [Afipia felis ATCC 53690]SUU75028.1 Acyl-[acyl-carrier-protein]--UDP-N-acetylglucosamine O-acyltransferase [Afipia felis]SUU83094.1 Acyl-[acyl-carrier-protein]--UDP-N-acetylglucosamine O-acyltransferase [Afipia felis]
MKQIDPAARVEDGAVVGEGTTIGPYCLIGPNVVIGTNCKLLSHVTVTGHTSIGNDCVVSPFSSLGGAPQDLSYRDELTRLEIGSGCVIREGVTMNRGTINGGGVTHIGDRGFFMNNSHVAHDCIVGDDVVFATAAVIGGHCEVGNLTFLGGLSAVHQFSRIGPQVMVGGLCGVRGDIIPYGLANGQYAALEGLNIVGMKRRKFTRERLTIVRGFYQKLFHGSGGFAERLARLQHLANEDHAIAEILAFIGTPRRRALCIPRTRINGGL